MKKVSMKDFLKKLDENEMKILRHPNNSPLALRVKLMYAQQNALFRLLVNSETSSDKRSK